MLRVTCNRTLLLSMMHVVVHLRLQERTWWSVQECYCSWINVLDTISYTNYYWSHRGRSLTILLFVKYLKAKESLSDYIGMKQQRSDAWRLCTRACGSGKIEGIVVQYLTIAMKVKQYQSECCCGSTKMLCALPRWTKWQIWTGSCLSSCKI